MATPVDNEQAFAAERIRAIVEPFPGRLEFAIRLAVICALTTLVVELEGDTFTQVFPEERGEFNCSDDYVVPTDPAAAGVKLDENRVSTAFAKK